MDTKNWLENIVYACNIQRYATELILEIHFDCQKFIRSKNRENQMDQEPRRNKSNNPNKIKEKNTIEQTRNVQKIELQRQKKVLVEIAFETTIPFGVGSGDGES